MKFVSLQSERTHRQGKLEKPSSAKVEFFTKPMALSHQIRTYTELLQQIYHELRIQHPEWVQSNGESPMCDAYEVRLTELLDTLTRRASNNSQRGKSHMNPVIQLKR
jgi:hypothetical protein